LFLPLESLRKQVEERVAGANNIGARDYKRGDIAVDLFAVAHAPSLTGISVFEVQGLPALQGGGDLMGSGVQPI
jgi:hypothetical protein